MDHSSGALLSAAWAVDAGRVTTDTDSPRPSRETVFLPQDRQTPLGAERMLLLDDLATALKGSGDLGTAIRNGARSLVPQFAELVVLMAEREGKDWLEVIHQAPDEEGRVIALLQPQLPAVRRAASSDWQTGRQFRWIPRVSTISTRFLWTEPSLTSLVQVLGVRSLVVVPMRASGQVLGGLAFGRVTKDSAFNAADLALAQVIARRIAGAIDKSWLEERLVDGRARQQRLESALHKWSRVFDTAGWGAAIIDGDDQRIEVVNPAFARLHGYPGPESLVGRLYTDLLTSDQAKDPARWLCDRDRGLEPYESLHLRADGSLFPVLTDVTPLPSEAGAISFVVTVQDLSDLKRAEERLLRAQRLEAVGRLSGGVAHEVNNMMTIILGFSDLLARSMKLPPERAREVEEIRKAATRAGKITQQLLAFSRQQILQPNDLWANQVVAELVPVLRLLLPANIVLETSLSPANPAVHVDRAQLDQVIINLAFNARDAMPGGGTLRLVTESRRLEEAEGRRRIGIPIPDGQYAIISVVDTGHGMEPAVLQQVFEPFFTTKPVGSGTGLGLATVYGIVKQSGGYVWVESSPGVGTTVTVCLPEVQGKLPLTPPRVACGQSSEGRTGTVLVVEDEEGVRQLAIRVLADQGHRVLEARDGEDALSQFQEFASELDLVLSDVIVPGIGTSDFDQRIRELRPDLPILYMSGYSREEMVERGLISADRPFLQKPFTAEELTDLVCRELQLEVETGGGPVTS